MEHPELVGELPKDIVALEWGYEHDHPFAEHSAKFAASGIPFYVCPGTGSWNTVGGRTTSMLGNVLNAAENGIKHGARGMLMTDWGDNGHLQPLTTSYAGYAFGAATGWCLQENRDIDLARALSMHVFQDAAGNAGRLALEIGDVYQLIPWRTHNRTAIAMAAITPDDKLVASLRSWDPAYRDTDPASVITTAHLDGVLARLDELTQRVKSLKLGSVDGAIAASEFAYALQLMRYGALRLRRVIGAKKPPKAGAAEKALLKKVLAAHKSVWLMRNRPGGMKDSAANLLFKYDGN
jgi:hexosaminidase